MKNYIIEFNGEPIVALRFQRNGKAEITTGERGYAIRYTESEATECAAAIGRGAEPAIL